jgi:predicted MFS family arabinose efflux permease
MTRLFNLYRESFSGIQKNVWILSVAMFINRSGSMVLLFASLYFTKDLHFSIAQAGLVMSLYGAGSILGSYIGGWLTDRKNLFYIMFFSLISSGLILLLLLIATSPLWIGAIIFFYALAADMFRPANSKAIASYSNKENLTRSVSLVRLAVNLGFSVGPAIGGFIALYLGYKWLFVIDAFTGFAAAAMLYIYLPKTTVVETTHDHAVLNDSSTSAYRDGTYLLFILLVAFYGICFFQLFASIPQYFARVCNYKEDVIGLLLALNGLLVVVVEMPLITVLGKKQKVFPYIIAGAICIPIAMLILHLGKGIIIWSVLYTIIITLSEVFAMPFMMNYALSRPKKERQGQYSALYSISYGIANIGAPLIGLGIADRYGFDAMFYFFIGLGLFVAVGFWVLQKISSKAEIKADF